MQYHRRTPRRPPGTVPCISSQEATLGLSERLPAHCDFPAIVHRLKEHGTQLLIEPPLEEELIGHAAAMFRHQGRFTVNSEGVIQAAFLADNQGDRLNVVRDGVHAHHTTNDRREDNLGLVPENDRVLLLRLTFAVLSGCRATRRPRR